MKLLPNITWARVADTYAYRHEPENLRALAEGYWRTLLSLVALIIVLAVLYGAFQLLAALGISQTGAPFLSYEGARSAALNRAQLQATLDGFTARQTNYESLKANRPKIADPSK